EYALEQGAAVDHLDERAPELAVLADLDLAAELGADGLLAVADAQDGHAQLEHRLRRRGRCDLGGRGRPAREDDRLRRERADGRVVHGARQDLGGHARLAHPPGDQLGVLGAEIEDQNAFGHGSGRGWAGGGLRPAGGGPISGRSLRARRDAGMNPIDPQSLCANWSYPTRVRFGPGRVAELPDACKALGMARPLLITDPGLAKHAIGQRVLEIARGAGLAVDLFADVRPNPTGANVAAGVEAFRAGGHDGVIALGGGSGLDAAKAV